MKSVTVSRYETDLTIAVTSIAGNARTHGQEQPEAPAIESDGPHSAGARGPCRQK
jgi:hypothetical protein